MSHLGTMFNFGHEPYGHVCIDIGEYVKAFKEKSVFI